MGMYSVTLASEKPVAPQFLGYLASALYVVEAVLFGFTFYFLFNSDRMFGLITGLVFVLIFIGLFICSRRYRWYISADLRVSDKDIKYEVLGILDVLGNRKTVYKARNITKIKKNGSSLVVYGECSVKEPVGREKACNKFVIDDCTDEVVEKISALVVKGV